jgi:large subunit ribosomal protein L35Ae
MEAIVINYRRGRKTQTVNQMVIVIEGVDTKEAATALVGKTVIYTCTGKTAKTISGKITFAHGSKGAVRVLFETGMPGQAIGAKVEVQ